MEPPERIEVTGSEGLVLTWADGTVTHATATALRRSCPCADCRTERESRPKLRLTALGPEPSIAGAGLVGDYGLGITFGPDGHRTGIFTWELLAEVSVPADTSGTST